jgi:hypothetical protein
LNENKRSTTGRRRLPEGFKPEKGVPLKLLLLRWKLYRKAKQEPENDFSGIGVNGGADLSEMVKVSMLG